MLCVGWDVTRVSGIRFVLDHSQEARENESESKNAYSYSIRLRVIVYRGCSWLAGFARLRFRSRECCQDDTSSNDQHRYYLYYRITG